jgi:hypothetical protein
MAYCVYLSFSDEVLFTHVVAHLRDMVAQFSELVTQFGDVMAQFKDTVALLGMEWLHSGMK